jgi:RING finger protein 113A
MEDPQPTPDVPQFTFKKRNQKSKSTIRKRPATPPPNADSDSDSGFSSFEDEEGQRQVKRRRRNAGAVTASSTGHTSARREPSTQSAAPVVARINKDDATKQSNWYDEQIEKENSEKPSTAKRTDDSAPDGTYKGVANYQSFIHKNPDHTPKQVGPVKSSTNVRTITVTDFAPDVCKDYKQTGFCGFGDNCKFLHAREDYKQGWQLDRDWEISTKGKAPSGKTVASATRNAQTVEDEDDEKLLESIPFACVICKESYKNPIVTKCGHYFCEACALKRYRKDPSCAACGSGTSGVFNVAKKLNRLLDRKRERERARKEKAGAAGAD